MKRLYFLSPNLDSTTSIVSELHELGIRDKDIHVAGKNHTGLVLNHIHEASPLQTSDVIPALEKGAATGMTTGLLAGLIAVSFAPAGLVLGGGAIVGFGIFGAGFGTWVSGMIGISIPNKAVEQYEQAIEEGQFLIMVDIPKEDEFRTYDLIRRHHPEVNVGEIDLTMNQAT